MGKHFEVEDNLLDYFCRYRYYVLSGVSMGSKKPQCEVCNTISNTCSLTSFVAVSE